MAVKKLSLFLGFALVYCTVVFSDSAKAQTLPVKSPGTSKSTAAAKTFAGVWQLTKDVADKAKKQNLKNLSQSLNLVSFRQSENLAKKTRLESSSSEIIVLTIHKKTEITINEGLGDILQARKVIADGKQRVADAPNGVNFSVRASQIKGKLIIETLSNWGDKMTEIFELVTSGNRLKVTLEIESPHSKLTMHGMYDRTTISSLADGQSGL